MAFKISKSIVKEAWKRLEDGGESLSDSELNELLTAAAVVALSQESERIRWIQPPPPGTVLEFHDRNVMLTFDPAAEIQVAAQIPESMVSRAREVLEKVPSLKRPLQILGLKGMAGDIEWVSEPSFQNPSVQS